ncbi:hypothetical protein MRB53_042064 [Persea americana]|nr:hypothetical protein MRB53_042064 [Persea americana]
MFVGGDGRVGVCGGGIWGIGWSMPTPVCHETGDYSPRPARANTYFLSTPSLALGRHDRKAMGHNGPAIAVIVIDQVFDFCLHSEPGPAERGTTSRRSSHGRRCKRILLFDARGSRTRRGVLRPAALHSLPARETAMCRSG